MSTDQLETFADAGSLVAKSPADAGSLEQLANFEAVYGDPKDWTLTEVVSGTSRVVADHPQHWFRSAAAASVLFSFPPFLLLAGPLCHVIAVGSVAYLAEPEEETELDLAGVFERRKALLGRILWVGFLELAVTFGALLAGTLPAALTAAFLGFFALEGAIWFLPGLLLAAGTCTALYASVLATCFAMPVAILEDRTGLDALRTSAMLARKSASEVLRFSLWLFLITTVSVFACAFAFDMPAQLLAAALAKMLGHPVLAAVLAMGIYAVAGIPSTLVVLWGNVAWTLFYLRQRARTTKEELETTDTPLLANRL